MAGFLASLAVGLMVSIASPSAMAESKTCVLDKTHCSGCVDMVTDRLCDESQFSTCKVRVVDVKKEIGELKIETKDKNGKVVLADLNKKLAGTDYKVVSCK